jgi:PAS domain S-box-containing protein
MALGEGHPRNRGLAWWLARCARPLADAAKRWSGRWAYIETSGRTTCVPVPGRDPGRIDIVSEIDPATQPPSLDSLASGDKPFVLADDHGVVIDMNNAFRDFYGWDDAGLIGEPIGLILPEAFRMAHQLGFSRFTATEQSTILGHPLRLKTLCADGRVIVSEHFIVAEKRTEGWVFGATLTPLPEGSEPDQ